MLSPLSVGGVLHALCVQEAQLARYTCACACACAAHPLCTRSGTRRRCASSRRAKARAATRASLRAESSPQDGESALPSRLSGCSTYTARTNTTMCFRDARVVCSPQVRVRCMRCVVHMMRVATEVARRSAKRGAIRGLQYGKVRTNARWAKHTAGAMRAGACKRSAIRAQCVAR